MKTKIVFIVLLTTLFTYSSPIKWNKVNLDFKEISVQQIYSYGDYQFITVNDQFVVYRKHKDESQWLKVFEKIDSYSYYPVNLFYFGGKIYLNFSVESYTSDDFGNTWKESPKLSSNLKLTSADSNTIYHISYHNISTSIDTGKTWDVLESNSEENLSSIDTWSNGTFVGGWGQIYITRDHGITWNLYTVGLPERCSIRKIASINDTLLFASTDNGLYRSTDSAHSWILLDSNFTAAKGNVLTKFEIKDSTLFAISDKGIYKFSTSGDTIIKINIPIHQKYNKNDISLFNNKLYVAGYNGVYVSENMGESFILINEGIELKRSTCQLAFDTNRMFVTTTPVDNRFYILRSYDNANTFDTLSISESNYLPSIYIYKNIIKLSNHISFDNGNNWIKSEYTENPIASKYIKNINDTLYYQELDTLFISSDNGTNWKSVVTDTSLWLISKIGDKCIFNQQHQKFNKGAKPSVWRTGHYSYNFGKTISDSIDELRWVTSIIKNNNNEYIAVAQKGIRYSNDFGETWEIIDSDKSINQIIGYRNDILIARKNTQVSVGANLATDFLFSLNKGKTWHPLIHEPTNDTLSRGDIVVVHENDIYLTNENGIFKTTFDEIAQSLTPITSKTNTYKKNFLKVKRNGNSFKLNFELLRNEKFNVSIYNSQGKQIYKINKNGVIGDNQLLINNRFSNGFYIIKISTLSNQITKPLIISK